MGMNKIDWVAYGLVITGALVHGGIGFSRLFTTNTFDLSQFLFGWINPMAPDVVKAVVGVAGVYGLYTIVKIKD